MPRTPADRRAYAQGAEMGFNYIADNAASLFLHPRSYNCLNCIPSLAGPGLGWAQPGLPTT